LRGSTRLSAAGHPNGDAATGSTGAFLAAPREQQDRYGIGLNNPSRMVVNGREALVGWYNAEACRTLAGMMCDQA
jgi:hypothetical protein